jgi:hypothetical protein
MALVINTPQGIEHWRMASAIAMLKLEVDTGMKAARYSILKACKMNWDCPKNTKAGALKWMLELYKETYGLEYGAK